MKRYFIAGVALGFMASAVLAQTPPADASVIDFGPAINQTLGIVIVALGTLLSGLVAFGLRWLNARTGLVNANTQSMLQKQFDVAMANMMAAGEAVAKSHIPKDGKFEVNNPFLREAVKFGLDHYPDLIGKISLESLATSILARLPTGELTQKADAIREAGAAAPPAA